MMDVDVRCNNIHAKRDMHIGFVEARSSTYGVFLTF
jgi:hypothetical protein